MLDIGLIINVSERKFHANFDVENENSRERKFLETNVPENESSKERKLLSFPGMKVLGYESSSHRVHKDIYSIKCQNLHHFQLDMTVTIL